MTNVRTVTLARVSSKAQEDEGYSLNAQQKLIREYCRTSRLHIVSEFKMSETASTNEHRIIFRQLLAYIAKNNITHLVVEKTDRLTRNFRDAVVVDDWLELNEHRRLHMVKEGLVIHKHARSDAKLMWNIYLAFAKKYTDNLREEAMKGWYEKLAQGWMPAPPPPGYKTVTESYKKIHIVDEDTSFLVKRLFQLYQQPGQTIATVTHEAAQCGLTTRKNRSLTTSAVHKMLRNPFYIGVIRFNAHEYPGAHEPLIDKDLFWLVQEKLGEKRQSKTFRHNPLFKGMILCKDCKGMITWQLQKGYRYGACQRRNEHCKQHPLIRQDRLEDIVLDELQKIDESDLGREIFIRLNQKLEENKNPYIGEHRLNVMKLIKRQIQRYESMGDNLYEDKLAGAISEEVYLIKVSEIIEKSEQLRDRLHRIEVIEGETDTHEFSINTLVGLYQHESKTGKRIILNHLFKIDIANGIVRFTPYHKNLV